MIIMGLNMYPQVRIAKSNVLSLTPQMRTTPLTGDDLLHLFALNDTSFNEGRVHFALRPEFRNERIWQDGSQPRRLCFLFSSYAGDAESLQCFLKETL